MCIQPSLRDRFFISWKHNELFFIYCIGVLSYFYLQDLPMLVFNMARFVTVARTLDDMDLFRSLNVICPVLETRIRHAGDLGVVMFNHRTT